MPVKFNKIYDSSFDATYSTCTCDINSSIENLLYIECTHFMFTGNRIHNVFINGENPNLTVGKKRGGKLEPVTPLTIQIPKSTSGDISLHSQSDSESDHNASKLVSFL